MHQPPENKRGIPVRLSLPVLLVVVALVWFVVLG